MSTYKLCKKFQVHRAVLRNIIPIEKQLDAPMYEIYFRMTLYMFRTVFPSIISSSRLYIQLSNRYCCLLASKQTADGRKDRPKHVE